MDHAEPTFPPRKLAGIAFVALLHVGILYALLSGLGVQVVQSLQQPLETQIVQEVKPPPIAPPPPPPPQMITPPPPFIPLPLVQIAQPPPPPVIAAVAHVRPAAPPPAPIPAPPPRPAQAAVRPAPSLDPNQSCAPPDYPQQAEEMEQTGVSVLQFLISSSGSVVDSKVAGSSGHAALDEAAVAALSRCRFKPAMGADGKPQEAWTNIRYVWQLQ